MLERHVQERERRKREEQSRSNECGGTDSANEGKKKDGSVREIGRAHV